VEVGWTLLSGVMSTLEVDLKQMSHGLGLVSATLRCAYTLGNDMMNGCLGCGRAYLDANVGLVVDRGYVVMLALVLALWKDDRGVEGA